MLGLPQEHPAGGVRVGSIVIRSAPLLMSRMDPGVQSAILPADRAFTMENSALPAVP